MPKRASVVLASLFLGLWSQLSTCAADRPASPTPLRVAVYDDTGTSSKLPNLLEALAKHSDLRVDRVDAESICSGCLASYDALIQPGGSGSRQGKTLGEEGREQIRGFVRKGGGYLGICAGAYLATSDYTWSLHILDAKVVDRAHWARGTGMVDVALTTKGRELLGVANPRPSILYFQGPLLAPADDPRIPDYEVLGRFDGEVAKHGAPTGVMKGTTAIAAAPFESGRVLCISPHPERTDNLHDMVYRALLWVTRR
jgi:putative intracellular protease/amidase